MRREQIGDCELWLGDARELVGEIPADVCVTDPPYGIEYSSNRPNATLWGAEKFIRGDRDTTVRDDVLAALNLPSLVFGSWRAPRPAGTRMVLIWDKGGALGMGALDLPWKPDHEEIYVIGKGFVGERDSGSVLRHPPVQSMAKNGRQHPNEKPVSLMMDLIRKTRGKVIDPFMGSCSTGVACAGMGRSFVGVEAHPGHYETALRRIELAYRQPRLFTEPPARPVQEAML